MCAGAGDAFSAGGRLHWKKQLHRLQIADLGYLSVVPVPSYDNSTAAAYILIYISKLSTCLIDYKTGS